MCLHTALLWEKSPDFSYLCVYKSICQRLAFACKSCIHRRFICGCKGLHVVFYTLEQKAVDIRALCVLYIDCELFIRKSERCFAKMQAQPEW
nr:MAG TPA: hypothetical protein [Inoviridae sp.]